MPPRDTFRAALNSQQPLLLPVAHDALSAKIIERAGFEAYQVGGFAGTASLHGLPDLELEQLGSRAQAAGRIIRASNLPVLIDADDGYGDVKNVTYTVQTYDEFIGASGIFLEDQKPPKKCGHMAGKQVVSVEDMCAKLRAAVAARQSPDFFILARTDAISTEGLDGALQRAEAYLSTGVDGIYVEGIRSTEEASRVGSALGGRTVLATSILEGGGETPWMPPAYYGELGFSVLLYPTTLLFQMTFALEQAVSNLAAGRPMPADDACTMDHFERIVGLAYWQEIERRFSA